MWKVPGGRFYTFYIRKHLWKWWDAWQATALFLQDTKNLKGVSSYSYIMKPLDNGIQIKEASVHELIQFSPFSEQHGASHMETKYVHNNCEYKNWFKERKWTFLSTFKAILDAPWGSNTPLCTHYTTTPGSVSTPWKSHISILHWASSVTHSAPQYQRHRVSGIVVIKRLLLRHELKVCAVLGDILFTPVSLARGHSESPGQTGCRKSSWRCTSGIFEVCSTPPCSLQWNSGEPVEQTLREFCPQVISLIKCLKYHVKIFAQFGKLPFYCFRKWIMDAIPAVGNPDALRFIKEKYLAETITVFEAVQALITSFHMVTATTEAIEVIEVGKSQHI